MIFLKSRTAHARCICMALAVFLAALRTVSTVVAAAPVVPPRLPVLEAAPPTVPPRLPVVAAAPVVPPRLPVLDAALHSLAVARHTLVGGLADTGAPQKQTTPALQIAALAAARYGFNLLALIPHVTLPPLIPRVLGVLEALLVAGRAGQAGGRGGDVVMLESAIRESGVLETMDDVLGGAFAAELGSERAELEVGGWEEVIHPREIETTAASSSRNAASSSRNSAEEAEFLDEEAAELPTGAPAGESRTRDGGGRDAPVLEQSAGAEDPPPATLDVHTTTLANGVLMPRVGFGTWQLNGTVAYSSVKMALEAGVRHIDLAENYGNDVFIGNALGDSGIPREQVFITHKISHFASFGMVRFVVRGMLGRLWPRGRGGRGPRDDQHGGYTAGGLPDRYLDLLLLHRFPAHDPSSLQQTWSALEEEYAAGRVRALGVSNFDTTQLNYLLSFAKTPPHVVQNKFSVFRPGHVHMDGEEDFLAAVQKMRIPAGAAPAGIARAAEEVEELSAPDGGRGPPRIAFVGYSCLFANPDFGSLLAPAEDPIVKRLAEFEGNITAAQLLHRYSLMKSVLVIPKSTNPRRIRENSPDELLLARPLSAFSFRVLETLVLLHESSLVPGEEVLRPLWARGRVLSGKNRGLLFAQKLLGGQEAEELLGVLDGADASARGESGGGEGEEAGGGYQFRLPITLSVDEAENSAVVLSPGSTSEYLELVDEHVVGLDVLWREHFSRRELAEDAVDVVHDESAEASVVSPALPWQTLRAASAAAVALPLPTLAKKKLAVFHRDKFLQDQISDEGSLLNAVSSDNLDRIIPARILGFLRSEPALRLAHCRDVMVRHLVGTFVALRLWGAPLVVAKVGVLHSVYGAGGQFRYRILGRNSRFRKTATSHEEDTTSTHGSSKNFDSSRCDGENLSAYWEDMVRSTTTPTTAQQAKTETNVYINDASIECHTRNGDGDWVGMEARSFVAGLVGREAERLIYLYSVIDFKLLVELLHLSGHLGGGPTLVSGWRVSSSPTGGEPSSSSDHPDASSSTGPTGDDGDKDTTSSSSKKPVRKWYLLSSVDVRILIIVAMADTLDQSNTFGHCGWVQWLRGVAGPTVGSSAVVEKTGFLWPGPGRPPVMLYPQLRLCQIMRRGHVEDEEVFVVPAAFGFCAPSQHLSEREERKAAEIYWEDVVLTSGGSTTFPTTIDAGSIGGGFSETEGAVPHSREKLPYQSAAPLTQEISSSVDTSNSSSNSSKSSPSRAYFERSLRAQRRVIELNPFLGEPWLLLGQMHFARREFAKAYFCANTALLKMLQLGTCWDKRFSYQSWLAGARVLRARALNLVLRGANGANGAASKGGSSSAPGIPVDGSTGLVMDEFGLVDLSVFKF